MNIAFFLYRLGVFSKVTERNGKSEVERSSNHGFTLQTTKMPGSGPSQESWSSSRSPEHLGRHGLLLQVHEEGAGLIGTGSSRTPSSTYVGCQNYGEQHKALGHSNCALTRHSAIKPYLIWFVDFASVWLDDWLEMLTKERRGAVKWVVIFLVPSSIADLCSLFSSDYSRTSWREFCLWNFSLKCFPPFHQSFHHISTAYALF